VKTFLIVGLKVRKSIDRSAEKKLNISYLPEILEANAIDEIELPEEFDIVDDDKNERLPINILEAKLANR
jgi:hypothetical protein